MFRLGFLTFLIGGLGLVKQEKKTEATLDRLIVEVWERNKKVVESKKLGIKEVYKPE